MKDYSQYGEQAVILGYFGNEVGNFLSLGENDGETLSNVRALALSGWHGVVVEPSPTAFAKLSKLYHDDAAVLEFQAAICDHNGEVELLDSGTHLGKGDTSLLSSILPSEVEKWKSTTKFDRVMVPAVTVEKLIEDCGINGFTSFDFINIDCEGYDMAIMAKLDLTALRCRMICVEYNGKDISQFSELAGRYGLRLRWRNGVNLIYAL